MSDAPTVFTNGCFDVIHVGHIRLLKHCHSRAIELGKGRVVVAINSDASVARLKGPGRPVNSQQEREEVLRAVKYVDDVIVFDEDTPLELLEKLRPDLIIKGGDYRPDEVVGRYVAPVEIFPLVQGHSTTAVLARTP